MLAAVSGQWTLPYLPLGLKSAPCVNALNQPVPCAAGFYGKRSADADPALLYTTVPFGSSSGLDPITQGLDPVTQGVALPYPHLYYGKRDAEADPQLLLPYAAFPAVGVHPSLVGVCTNYLGAQVPC